MMESAFDVIFKLADGPIKHIENIIKKLAVKTGVKLGGAFKIPASSQSQATNGEPMDFESRSRRKKSVGPSKEDIVLDAGHEINPSQMSQQHHHSQSNSNSALMLVRFLNCLGKSAVGIVYYVDCTVKDELLRRKEAKQTSAANRKQHQTAKKATKKRTKRKTLDEDDDNPSTSIHDTTSTSSNLTVNTRLSSGMSSDFLR